MSFQIIIYKTIYCFHAEGCDISDDYSPHRTLIAYAKIARGGSFMANLVQPFERVGYWFTSQPAIHETEDSFPLIEQMNGFKVCLAVITIHATAKQIVDARLFGSLAALVQLVKTSDRETIRRMYELWFTTFLDDAKLKDPEPEKLSEEMILTPDDFEVRVCKWHKAIDSPRDVWTGPDFDHLGRLVAGLHPENIYMPSHDFNRAHPWVQSILDEMPRFHPVIMFRFCEAKCYSRVIPPYDPSTEFDYFAGK
ncbi:hypothetical protein BPAE_0087g00250 [Botrytis paeoniae]|uniref:Uncharacterized protein n=1 Tax=Botrytis paeoniae TaxID=278948 RepID=A0A4Z1FNM7_9HELO|nr:hypothetical protein BPAE_0087g00250 [Botrytis paeoniae]